MICFNAGWMIGLCPVMNIVSDVVVYLERQSPPDGLLVVDPD